MPTVVEGEKRPRKVLVSVFMYETELKPGVCRIDTRFGLYLPYQKYPNFLKAVNEARVSIFGEEKAKQFRVSNDPVSETHQDVVWSIRVDAVSGTMVGQTALTAAEATRELQKIEALQIKRKAERDSYSREESTGSTPHGEEFGTPMAEALAAAKAQAGSRRSKKTAAAGE